jgi:hypothetical protein
MDSCIDTLLAQPFRARPRSPINYSSKTDYIIL